MRRLMKSRRVSYGQLSNLTNIPRSTLSGIANGSDRMSLRVLIALAAVFDTTTDEILGIGPGVAPPHRRRPSGEGGVVDLKGVHGRFIVPIGVDIPELELGKGDLIEMDTELPMALGKIVGIDDHDGVTRLYRVVSMDPVILERSGGPPVLFTEKYQKRVAVAFRLHRDL